MDYFSVIIPKLTSFFLLMLLGFSISKLKVITREGLGVLSSLLIKVCLPCLIINLLYTRGTRFQDLVSYHKVLGWQAAGYLLLALLGFATVKLARIKPPASNVHMGDMLGGNIGFFIIPVLVALFKDGNGAEYIPVCTAMDTLIVWSFGLALYTHGLGSREEAWYVSLAKRLATPIFFSMLGTLLFNSLGLRLPGLAAGTIADIGTVSSTLGLVYVGCSLCLMRKVKLESLKRVWLLVLTKQVLVPLLVWFLSSAMLTITERLTLLLMLGAPVMSTSSMIANQYKLDEDYASTAVFLTTICSLVTIPLLLFIVL